MPYLFEQALPQLYSHLLFSRNVNGHDPSEKEEEAEKRDPLLLLRGGVSGSGSRIMDLDVLAQLSLCIRGDRLWRRVRPLYTGSDDGYSMGCFETKVCKWNAPTIMLVAGTPLAREPRNSRERAFADVLPPHRAGVAAAAGVDSRVVFAVFQTAPWKVSYKHCFGDSTTLLVQLAPVHRVLRASTQSTDYAYFNRDDGIGFGVAPQAFKASHRPSPYFNTGPTSLVLDQGLEFGVFTHTGPGGAFLHDDAAAAYECRFEVDEVEVWGCGGETEAEAQRRAWQWEEREAMMRRQLNLGKDIEADRVGASGGGGVRGAVLTGVGAAGDGRADWAASERREHVRLAFDAGHAGDWFVNCAQHLGLKFDTFS